MADEQEKHCCNDHCCHDNCDHEKCSHETHDHDCCGCGCGCGCGHVDVSEVPDKGLSAPQKKKLTRIVACGVFLVVIIILQNTILAHPATIDFANSNFVICLVLYAICYLAIGYDILLRAAKNIAKGKVFDENFLMTVATIGAIALGFLGDGDFVEAIAVMLFYQIGEWFEGYAVGRSRKNITNLMDIRPDFANIEVRGKLKQVAPETLQIGAVIVVQPGEKIPIDGVVVEGTSTLNTSALTGESAPREVEEGMEVVSGCISMTGVLKIKTTKLFSESTVSKILDLVENASDKKSASENFITKFARVYTPIVCICALVLAIVPPLFLTLLGQESLWFEWLYRALTFLVISCPCALVISIPLSFFAGIGCASKNGILIKGSSFLESLSKLSTVVFDKTGTLTKGTFKVVDVDVANLSYLECFTQIANETSTFEHEQSLLIAAAAYAESASSHPIAKSIISAFGGEVDRSMISDISEKGASGVEATIQDHLVRVGKLSFVASGLEASSTENTAEKVVGTHVYTSVDGVFVGSITIADETKETSKDTISELKGQGLRKTVMLTGDNESVAKYVASELGLDEYHANLLPEDKVSEIERLQAEGDEGSIVGFVGDGINDAPVIMRSDVGIAMGALGSQAAIEAADVVLMDDNPLKLPTAMSLSRKCMRIVRQNIVFALTVKISFLILSAFGLMNMYGAIFADVGVMILAVLNAMRALMIRN